MPSFPAFAWRVPGEHQLSPGDVKFSEYSSKQHESLIYFNFKTKSDRAALFPEKKKKKALK